MLVGYLVALAAQQLVFPLFGIHTTIAQDSAIAAAFTAVSLARSYLLRRIFERHRHWTGLWVQTATPRHLAGKRTSISTHYLSFVIVPLPQFGLSK